MAAGQKKCAKGPCDTDRTCLKGEVEKRKAARGVKLEHSVKMRGKWSDTQMHGTNAKKYQFGKDPEQRVRSRLSHERKTIRVAWGWYSQTNSKIKCDKIFVEIAVYIVHTKNIQSGGGKDEEGGSLQICKQTVVESSGRGRGVRVLQKGLVGSAKLGGDAGDLSPAV